MYNNEIHGQTQFKVNKVYDQYHNTYQHKVVTVCQTNIKTPPPKTEWFVKIHLHYYQISLQCTFVLHFKAYQSLGWSLRTVCSNTRNINTTINRLPDVK